MHFQKPMLGTPLDWGNPHNKDLVLAYALNEGHGDVVRDLSMNGNHGTLNNFAFPPTVASGWNPGQTGIGLNFDGTDDYVDCGNDESLDITDEITFSCWVNPSATATGFIISKYQDSTHRYETVMTSTYFVSAFGDGTTSKIAKYTMTPVAGIWYHIATNINSSGVIKIYVDGIEGELSETLPNPVASITGDLIIGKRDSAFFNGSIDQVRIHNRALTAKEIKDYYINPWQVYLDEDDD